MKRVLIVEDEVIPLFGLKKYLERMGHVVTGAAADAQTAFQAVQQQQPDVILMDVRIKGSLDGFEAMAVIRQYYQIPVIYITPFADLITSIRANQTPNAMLLVKPVAESALKAAIEAITEPVKA